MRPSRPTPILKLSLIAVGLLFVIEGSAWSPNAIGRSVCSPNAACADDETAVVKDSASNVRLVETFEPIRVEFADAAADRLQPDPTFEIPPNATRLLSAGRISPDVWQLVSAKRDAEISSTWTQKLIDGEPVLECSGQPFGLLRSEQKFEMFRCGMQWRFVGDGAGNSGLLVHAGSELSVWPRSIQVQLSDSQAGTVIPMGGAALQAVEQRKGPAIAIDSGWNSCVVSSERGVLRVFINNKEAATARGCDPQSGAIGFQSEGSVVQFRRIWIQERPTQRENESASDAATDSKPRPPANSDGDATNDAIDLRDTVPVGSVWHGRDSDSICALAAYDKADLGCGHVYSSRFDSRCVVA